MTTKTVLGIDPGIKGALSVICNSEIVGLTDMPIARIDKRTFIDGFKLSKWIKETLPQDSQVWMEFIAPYRQQNIKSTFTQARLIGAVESILFSEGFRAINYVPPKTWQKGVNKIGNDKKESIDRAKEIFSTQANQITNDGRAEALLIAYYGLQQYSDD